MTVINSKMAFPWTPLNPHPLLIPLPSSSINPHPNFFPFLNFKPLKFNPYCSSNPTSPTQTNPNDLKLNHLPKKKRKPKPSFYEQIREKWSSKPICHTHKLPWQLQKEQEQENCENLEETPSKMVGFPENGENISGFVEGSILDAQVIGGGEFEGPMFNFGGNLDQKLSNCTLVDGAVRYNLDNKLNYSLNDSLDSGLFDEKSKFIVRKFSDNDDSSSENDHSDVMQFNGNSVNDLVDEMLDESKSNVKEDKAELCDSGSKNDEYSKSYRLEKDASEGGVRGSSSPNRVPWMRESNWDGERRMRSKTELAERIIPEHELRRLRNVALRMKERMKVGVAGVTQAVVDAVHEKWKIDEVVKFKFEGPLTLNMKRVHDVLESKTGGVIIWRSGSSVALYRGLTYKLDCVKTYAKEKGVHLENLPQSNKSVSDSLGLQKNVSEEELMEASEFDNLLDGLGPRYVDWSGRPPLPVDADLLPGVVPEYKTPFRLLPHGVRRSLTDKETTNFRRQARIMPPHFALGRNRELHGLAAAIVKLWEKSAVAKIAIKRGVLNTSNERMTEELKRLTGGVLLSRNKDFIVFYRGNDFLPPPVTESLKEREKLSVLQYQEEEACRSALSLINSHSPKRKIPFVAGTLAETAAATTRWGKQPNSEEVEKMLKDSALTRHTAVVNHLQNKLAIAIGKLKRAEKALEKVQEYLEPEELPTDLETITDEERLVFRKMGLSMKPHLLLGRREVFDGTIENMHMHWKFREVVKIIVKGKSFGQLKHISISLEAESGGVLVSIDKTTKGYAIIFYRGKNYRQPVYLKPRNLLTRRQALARSIELQRREALKHHISDLQEQMELVKSELGNLEDGKELNDKSLYEELDNSSIPTDDVEEDSGEEAYLQTYDSGDEKEVASEAS